MAREEPSWRRKAGCDREVVGGLWVLESSWNGGALFCLTSFMEKNTRGNERHNSDNEWILLSYE